MTLGENGRTMSDFGRPLGPKGLSKYTIFVINQHKMKKYNQRRSLEKKESPDEQLMQKRETLGSEIRAFAGDLMQKI